MSELSDFDLIIKQERSPDKEKDEWIERVKALALLEKKNKQLLYSVAGGYQIYDDIPKFGPADGPYFVFNLIHKTTFDFIVEKISNDEAEEKKPKTEFVIKL